MPKQKQRKQQRQQRQRQNKRSSSSTSNQKRRRSRRSSSGKGVKSAMRSMLMDPCSTELQRGFYGSKSGYLLKTNQIFGCDSGHAAGTSGYMIWFPDFTNPGAQGTGTGAWNCLFFAAASASTAPAALSFGNVATTDSTTAHSFADPSWSFLNSSTCSDLRTVGACLRVQYIGALQTCSGMIYPLTNIPYSLFNGTAGTWTPPSATMLMNYAGQASRPLDPFEIRWRPQLDSMKFRGYTDMAYQTTNGSNAAPIVQAPSPEVFGIGFAFQNVQAFGANFNVRMFKNIEWRPEFGSGFPAAPPSHTDSSNIFGQTLEFLDEKVPGWQQQAAGFAENVLVNTLSNMAIGGGYLRGAPVPRSITYG